MLAAPARDTPPSLLVALQPSPPPRGARRRARRPAAAGCCGAASQHDRPRRSGHVPSVTHRAHPRPLAASLRGHLITAAEDLITAARRHGRSRRRRHPGRRGLEAYGPGHAEQPTQQRGPSGVGAPCILPEPIRHARRPGSQRRRDADGAWQIGRPCAGRMPGCRASRTVGLPFAQRGMDASSSPSTSCRSVLASLRTSPCSSFAPPSFPVSSVVPSASRATAEDARIVGGSHTSDGEKT